MIHKIHVYNVYVILMWLPVSFRFFIARGMFTPTQYQCCSRKRLWV